jgi:hypothetical protein
MAWRNVMRADANRIRQLRSEVDRLWSDRLSRGCLLATAASIWLTVALVEPMFLIVLVGAGTATWLRRRQLAAMPAPEDEWDWS